MTSAECNHVAFMRARVQSISTRQDEIAALDSPTTQQLDEFDSLHAERNALVASIDALQSRPPRGRGLSRPAGDPWPAPGRHDASGAASAGQRTYASLFGAPPRSGDFESLAEYLGAHIVNDSGKLGRYMTGPGAAGINDPSAGFLVPEQFAALIQDAAVEDELILPRANVIPMASSVVRVPAYDDRSHATGLYGGASAAGFSGGFTVEGGSIDYEAAQVRQIVITALKLAIVTRATTELATDAPGFEAGWTRRMGTALGWTRDFHFLNGTGVGQPLGILKDPALITVNKQGGQAATTFVYENAVNMLARLHPACWNNAIWIFNPTVFVQLAQMTIAIGTSGVLAPALTGQPGQQSLFGRPVIFSEKLATLGTLGDALLVDVSQYIVGMRAEMRLDRSDHVRFTSDEIVWRLIQRLNGQGSWASAFTPKNGNTLSWAVTLQAR